MRPEFEELRARATPGAINLAIAAGLTPTIFPVGDKGALLADLGYNEKEFDDALKARVENRQDLFTVPFSPQVRTVDGLYNGSRAVSGADFDMATATWYMQDGRTFDYGAPGWIAVTGDWDGNGTVTIGVVDPSTETWYLKNDNHAGETSVTPFAFGGPGWRPFTVHVAGLGRDGPGVISPDGLYHMASVTGVTVAHHA